ncbi:MAG: LLM class F420-dependent oxidoreductase [Candidatus Methylomirabilales bacterium]
MRFGFSIPTRGALGGPETIRRLAEAAEQLQYDSVWITDHVVLPRQTAGTYPYDPAGRWDLEAAQHYLEALTVMSYAAGLTRRVRVGSSILVLPQRNPVLVAKAVATLDVLTGGRVILAVGVGWLKEEFEALGVRSFAERGAVTDEYIRLLRALWTEEWPSFRGRFYTLEEVRFFPKPVQRPHPPIWIGGHTPPALRRAGRLGDGWHPIGLRPPAGLRPDEYSQAAAEVRAHAQAAGRDLGGFTFSFRAPLHLTPERLPAGRTPFHGDPEQVVEDIRAYQRAGVSHLVFDLPGASLDALLVSLRRFAEEVRPLAQAGP